MTDDARDARSDRTGWTGGQVSLIRVLTGAVALSYAFPCTNLARCLAIIALSVVFAAGWYWRLAALGLLVLNLGHTLAVDCPLAWFACMPGVPYGSWQARGRLDPGGGFHVEPVFQWAARIFLLVSVVFVGLGWMIPDLGLPLLVLLACDPAWIPPLRSTGEERLFYDGVCGLCHRFVRFLLSEDTAGAIRLAPLQGTTFAESVPASTRDLLPDSLVLMTADGALLVRSAAAIHALRRLGGLWRVVAALLWIVPRPLRDAAYAGVAAVRKRIFKSPEALCPIVPPELAKRFDA